MAKNREGSSHRSLQHLSDHFDGERFHNLTHTSLKSLTQVIQWKLKGGAKKWPAWRDNDAKPDVALPLQDGLVRVTCINHLTYLIQTSKLTILTDPLFSQRASPFRAIGPKRVRAPGVALSELPWVDVVLVSHNHYDHMDIDSLNDLERRFHPQFVMPLGNRHYVSELASERVHELDWWQNYQFGERLKITAVPAHHWSSRTHFDRNRALWSGFALDLHCHEDAADQDKPFHVYFAGDTAFAQHFAQIRARWTTPDLAILPIGAYEPRWFMKDQHMNPDDAVRAHFELGARNSIGGHFGTFQLTDEAIDDPPLALAQALREHGVSAGSFRALNNGETWTFKA